MALTYTIDPNAHLVTITGEYAGADEWAEVLAHILEDPRRQPGFALLRDLRGATTPTDSKTVVAVIEVVRQFWPRLGFSRYAVLTPLGFDPAALVAEALAEATDDLPLRTFATYEEAMRWLREATVRP
jgi:hypothetical protein